jgi:hypothetical protein
MLPDGGLRKRSSILDRRKIILFSPKRPDRLWVTPSPVFSGPVGYMRLYRERKGKGPETDHTLLANAEVQNEWSYTSTPNSQHFMASTQTPLFYFTSNSKLSESSSFNFFNKKIIKA